MKKDLCPKRRQWTNKAQETNNSEKLSLFPKKSNFCKVQPVYSVIEADELKISKQLIL